MVELRRSYIYEGKIVGPGEVDFYQYEDEDGSNPFLDAVTAREQEFDADVEQHSIVDATQNSRLQPYQLRRDDLTGEEEFVTPATEEEQENLARLQEAAAATAPRAPARRAATAQPRPRTASQANEGGESAP